MVSTDSRKAIAFVCSDDIQTGSFSGLVTERRFREQFCPVMISLDSYYRGGFSKSWIQHHPQIPLYELHGDPRLDSDLRRAWLPTAWGTVLRHVIPEVEHCLEKLRPDLLVTTNDNGFVERVFIRTARARGIPSILVQEGVIAAASRTSIGDRIKMMITDVLLRPLALEILGTTRYGCGNCDILALYGDRAARTLKHYGVPPARIRVIGSMRNDKMVDAERDFDRKRAAEQLGVAPDATVHLVLSTNVLTGLNDPRGHELQLSEIRAIHRVVREHDPCAHVIVKLHPRDAAENYASISTLPQLKIVREFSLYDAVLLSRVVYCSLSGAAYEAIALGRPVFATAIEFQRSARYLSEIMESPLELIRSEDGLRSVLLRLQREEEYRRIVKDQIEVISGSVFTRLNDTAVSRFVQLLTEASSAS